MMVGEVLVDIEKLIDDNKIDWLVFGERYLMISLSEDMIDLRGDDSSPFQVKDLLYVSISYLLPQFFMRCNFALISVAHLTF